MTIYSTILSQHLAYRSVPTVVQKLSSQLVASALGRLVGLLPSLSVKPTALRA